MQLVTIIDYGSGNLRSAAKAFERAARESGNDSEILVTGSIDDVRRADRIVLPGVGAFGDCRAGLDAIDGMVEKEQKVDIDTLLKAMPLEERLYRHRCVEAWAIAVPWTGFPMKALLDYARPASGAKYVVMETFHDKDMAPGQRQFWYPWPYVEAITIEEAANELSLIGTGAYGKVMPKQNGAPLRLVVPWKYGFKQIKSIVRISLVEEQPVNSWQQIAADEYGFYANVNPEVDHPRWSQATEKLLGTGKRVPTLPYNGYAEQVAGLYTEIQKKEKIFY